VAVTAVAAMLTVEGLSLSVHDSCTLLKVHDVVAHKEQQRWHQCNIVHNLHNTAWVLTLLSLLKELFLSFRLCVCDCNTALTSMHATAHKQGTVRF
jgi:hypothetical protein